MSLTTLPPVRDDVANDLREKLQLTGDETFSDFLRRLLIAYEDAQRRERTDEDILRDLENFERNAPAFKDGGACQEAAATLSFTYPALQADAVRNVTAERQGFVVVPDRYFSRAKTKKR